MIQPCVSVGALPLVRLPNQRLSPQRRVGSMLPEPGCFNAGAGAGERCLPALAGMTAGMESPLTGEPALPSFTTVVLWQHRILAAGIVAIVGVALSR